MYSRLISLLVGARIVGTAAGYKDHVCYRKVCIDLVLAAVFNKRKKTNVM